MQDKFQKLLHSKRLFIHKNEGIQICAVSSREEGLSLTKEIIYELVDQKTALYLSGGSTPKPLYVTLAWEEKLAPGVVGLIDERYGDPMHEKSNERMITDTGLLRYFSMRDISYYSLLRGVVLEETANRYDQLYRSLGSVYRFGLGILGIGQDGHIAGIAPNRPDFINRLFAGENRHEMVSWFDDVNGPFKKRITMTFLGLSMLDLLLVPVFGEEKKQALHKIFERGKEEDLPARFFKRPDIASKTLLITDQEL